MLGYTPQLVRGFLKNGKRILIHMVSLKITNNAKDIYTTGDLFYGRVKIEPYKNSGPAQYFNCQNFGHSLQSCLLTARCVKCEKEHPTKECSNPKSEKTHCCNCGGEHAANYRECPHYIEQHKPNPMSNRSHIGKITRQDSRTISFFTPQPTQTVSTSQMPSNSHRKNPFHSSC